jgi:hypothetical protein
MKRIWTVFVIIFYFFLVSVFSGQSDIEQVPSFKISDEKYFIVEFNGLIFENNKNELRDEGVLFISYKGENKFLVKFDKNIISNVKKYEFVKSVSRNKKSQSVKSFSNVQSVQSFNVRSFQVENKEKFDIDVLDPSVVDLLVLEIENLGGEVLEQSSKKLRVLIEPGLVDFLRDYEEINYVEPTILMRILNDNSKAYLNVYNHFDNFGLYGEGQTVAVADTGLDIGVVNSSLHADFLNKNVFIDDTFKYASLTDDGASDLYSGHGTHVAASVLGTGFFSGANLSVDIYNNSHSGTAPKADLIFQAMEQLCDIAACDENFGEYILYTPNNLNQFFQPIYDSGAKIHTNSWGGGVYGYYSASSVDVDSFMWDNKDFIILFAAGNEGDSPDTILSPGTSKNVITVGASTGESSITGFSSRGPTDDGRIKPDVVAPGVNIVSARSSVASAGLWSHVDANYENSGGTSMSTPLVAGIVALISEYLEKNKSIPNPSSALIKAMVINGAKSITGNYVDMNQGWGFVDLNGSIYEDNNFKIDLVEVTSGLSTSSEYSYNFTILKSLNPLKITVVWTDYSGPIGSGVTLVNDLNVVLVSPNGTEYFGNDFTSPYNSSKDSLNNVEGIRIGSAEIGDYSLKIKGYNIPSGPQPFSFVISKDYYEVPSIEFTSPTLNEIVYLDNLSFDLKLNFSKDITHLSYFNGSSNVNLTNNLINNNSLNMVFNVSSFGNQSILFNLTDIDGFNKSYNLNFTLIQNLLYELNYPLNNTELNLSKLSFFLNLSFNKNISSLIYSIDERTFNITDLVNNGKVTDYLDIFEYGLFNVSFYYVDILGNVGNFTLSLNLTSNLKNNLTDYDEDGINNSIDKLIGTSINVNSNFNSLNILVNSSLNLSQLFNGTFSVLIGNSSEKIIEFSNNFSKNLIDLSKVVVKRKVVTNKVKIFINGLNLESGNTKTIYLKLNGDISKSNSLCLKDTLVYSFEDISANCSGSNETFITSVPSSLNGYNLTYFNSSNDIVKITGLTHSGVSQMCTENWSYSSWSSCSSNSQSRTAIDSNSCGTTFNKEGLVQSCTSEESSSSSGGNSGGGGGGGSSSLTSKTSNSETSVAEESIVEKFELIYPESDFEFKIFINGLLKSESYNFSDVRLVKIKNNLSDEIVSFDHNFSLNDLDLNLINIKYNLDNKSYVEVFGLENISKNIYLKNKLNSSKVCVSKFLSSENCSLVDEFILSCDGLSVQGVRCEISETNYVVSGADFVRVSEFVDIVVSSGSVYVDDYTDEFKIIEKQKVVNNDENVDVQTPKQDNTNMYIILAGLSLLSFMIISKIVVLFHHNKNKE